MKKNIIRMAVIVLLIASAGCGNKQRQNDPNAGASTTSSSQAGVHDNPGENYNYGADTGRSGDSGHNNQSR